MAGKTMGVWRPTSAIRVEALGLHWRGDRLLAFDVRDDGGRVKGVRPLGGGVEFGEDARTAAVREFKEELGIDVETIGEPVVVESLYVHGGTPGHEILFLFDVVFPPGCFEGAESVEFCEDDGTLCVARWHRLEDLDLATGPRLLPEGLRERLSARRLA